MSLLRYDAALQALLVTKGHPFERDAFFGLFEGLSDIACTHVEHPAAQLFFTPERARDWDAFVLYDMPGIEFRPDGPRFHDPPAAFVDGFERLLEAGHGFVFLHHAIAGWPTWDRYADVIGGRFLYAPRELRGEKLPDSGYRHGVTHRVSPAVANHPVLDGLQDGFEIEDELYLCRVFESDVTPLLTSDARFEDSEFYSASKAVQGEMFSREGWSHPPGSALAAWTHRVGASPIVYLAGGDGPSAYANPGFRRLVSNAIRFVASEARQRRKE